MSSERKPELRSDPAAGHRLELENRHLLTVTGVKEVLRFDETAVVLRVTEQLLVVRGEGLSLLQLAPQEGRVELRGRVDLLGYEGDRLAKGGLRRLFG